MLVLFTCLVTWFTLRLFDRSVRAGFLDCASYFSFILKISKLFNVHNLAQMTQTHFINQVVSLVKESSRLAWFKNSFWWLRRTTQIYQPLSVHVLVQQTTRIVLSVGDVLLCQPKEMSVHSLLLLCSKRFISVVLAWVKRTVVVNHTDTEITPGWECKNSLLNI